MKDSTLRTLRQTFGLREDDSSKDEAIALLSPAAKLRRLTRWKLGDVGWADWFLSVAQECGYEITEPKSSHESG